MIRSVYGLRTHKEMAGGTLEPTCTAILASTTTGVLRAPWLSFRLGLVFFCMISSELGVRYFLLLVCRQCISSVPSAGTKSRPIGVPVPNNTPTTGYFSQYLTSYSCMILYCFGPRSSMRLMLRRIYMNVPNHATSDFAVSINHYRI